jgi:hypothetical protein
MIIPPTWNLPDSIKSRLGQNTFGRQRAVAEEGHILLILHKPPGADDLRREGVLFWRDPAGNWLSGRSNSGAQALSAHVQSYADLDVALAQKFEKANDTKALHELLAAVTPLSRAAHNMHAALQDAREAVKGDKTIIELRDRAYEVDRNLDILLEDTRNAIAYRAAREAEEQNRLTREALRASHRLNVLAALFLPLTAIASIFSMDLKHGLSRDSVTLFWIVAAASLAVGIGVKGWVLAKESGASKPTAKPTPSPNPKTKPALQNPQ